MVIIHPKNDMPSLQLIFSYFLYQLSVLGATLLNVDFSYLGEFCLSRVESALRHAM